MTDDELLNLWTRLNDHIKVTGSMQHLLHALVLYVAEQPTFNGQRLLELYERERTRVFDPARPPKDRALEQILLDALLDRQSKKPS